MFLMLRQLQQLVSGTGADAAQPDSLPMDGNKNGYIEYSGANWWEHVAKYGDASNNYSINSS